MSFDSDNLAITELGLRRHLRLSLASIVVSLLAVVASF